MSGNTDKLRTESEIADEIMQNSEPTLTPPDAKFFPKHQPFNEFIFVQEIDEDNGMRKSKGGLFLPTAETSNEDLMEVVVVATSDKIYNEENGDFRDPRVAVNDHLWISTHHRHRKPQPWGDEEIQVIQEADIIGFLAANDWTAQQVAWKLANPDEEEAKN